MEHVLANSQKFQSWRRIESRRRILCALKGGLSGLQIFLRLNLYSGHLLLLTVNISRQKRIEHEKY